MLEEGLPIVRRLVILSPETRRRVPSAAERRRFPSNPVGLQTVAIRVFRMMVKSPWVLEVWGLALAWWDFLCMRRVWSSYFRFRTHYPPPS